MKYSKILILRLSAAGDIVLNFPAALFLADTMSGASIDWAVDERFVKLPGLLPCINKIIPFPSKILKNPYVSYIDKIKAFWFFIKEIRRGGYDLVIDFQGLFKSGVISFFSKSPVRAAFAPGGRDSREFNHIFNNKIIKIGGNDKHGLIEKKIENGGVCYNDENKKDGAEFNPLIEKILYRSLCLAARAVDVEIPGGYTPCKLIVPPENNAVINSFIDSIVPAESGVSRFAISGKSGAGGLIDDGNSRRVNGINKKDGENFKIIILNPFTNWPTKTWPVGKWIELIGLIEKEKKYKNTAIVILWGPAEKDAAERIASAANFVYLSPPTAFDEVFSLIDRADAVISGDSFALHAAFILNKPVVALFGASEPARCAPFGPNAAVVKQNLNCQHCFKKTCSRKTNECIAGIKPSAVLDALSAFL